MVTLSNWKNESYREANNLALSIEVRSLFTDFIRFIISNHITPYHRLNSSMEDLAQPSRVFRLHPHLYTQSKTISTMPKVKDDRHQRKITLWIAATSNRLETTTAVLSSLKNVENGGGHS